MVEQANLNANIETYRWMASRLKSLIEMGVQIGLVRHSKTLAESLVRLAEGVANAYPNDAELLKEAQEANRWLARLSILGADRPT